MDRLIKIGRIKTKSASEIKNSKIGIGFEKLDRKAFDPEKAYDKIADIGVKWVRIQSGWQRCEREKGVYDFSWLDDIVDNLIKRGMIPWINLSYGNDLYSDEAKKTFGAVGYPPIENEEQKQAWHDYVYALTKHFIGRVTYFEIWNEPDCRYAWKPFPVNADEVGILTKDTAIAVKEANKDAKTIGGALAQADVRFMDTVMEHSAEYLDFICYHLYSSDETLILQGARAFQALAKKYNPDIKVIMGESGGQSSPTGAGAMRCGAWSERKQAKYTLRHIISEFMGDIYFTSHFTSIDMIEALDGVIGNKATYLDYGYFGVLHADFDEDGVATGEYSKKPSYFALSNLCSVFSEEWTKADLPIYMPAAHRAGATVRLLDNFGEEPSGILYQGFEKPNGSSAFVYWKNENLMTTDFESVITIEAAHIEGDVHLVDLYDGTVYDLPDSILEDSGNNRYKFSFIPVRDYPLMITFGDFADIEMGC